MAKGLKLTKKDLEEIEEEKNIIMKERRKFVDRYTEWLKKLGINSHVKNKLRKRIVIDGKVTAGKPVIKGTRIPVDAIIHRIFEGMTIAQVLEEYPRLKKKDILAALEYNKDNVKKEVFRGTLLSRNCF